MRKKKTKSDPRAHTAPGHYLKNAPWRQDFVEEVAGGPTFSKRDMVILTLLGGSFVAVAAALWMNPPKMLRFQNEPTAVTAQATLAGHRAPRTYGNGLGYDPAKFEEVKEDDPIIQDDLEDVLLDEPAEEKPTQSL